MSWGLNKDFQTSGEIDEKNKQLITLFLFIVAE